jgi:hypothetical protein
VDEPEDDPILNRLVRLRREAEKLCGHSFPEPTEPKDLALFGLTADEAKDWIESEPDFKRQISSSLQQTKSNSRNKQTRRYQLLIANAVGPNRGGVSLFFQS